MDWEPRVGMRVVCVDAEGGPGLKYGHVYTIHGVCRTDFFDDRLNVVRNTVGIDLAEVVVENAAFRPSRFRPLDERRLDIFRSILTKAPTEKEPA